MPSGAGERSRPPSPAGNPMHPAPQPPATPTVLPTVLGILFTGLVVLALGFWVDARRGATDSAAAPAVPALVLVEPRSGAVLASPVSLVFEAPVRLRWAAGGWQAGRLHVHAGVNGSELMPAARDIERLGENRYRWTLPPLPPGEHTLRLFWSGPDHQPIAAGATEAIRIEVR